MSTIEEATSAIVRTIETVTKLIEETAADNSWGYADKAAAVVWQLSRALGEIPPLPPSLDLRGAPVGPLRSDLE